MILTLLACGFSASGTTVTGDSDSRPAGADDSPAPTDDSGEDSEAPPDPDSVDDDGDGWSENEGDCDDTDPALAPGRPDTCDLVDNDCDGDLDEDASGDDPYEPNDTTPFDVGSLEDQPTWTLAGTLQNDDETDRFQFSVTDNWYDDFTVTVKLTNIPAGATYRLTLNRLESAGEEPLGEMDQVFGEGTLEIKLEDTAGPEDGGVYEIVVDSVAGADCSRSYLLTVERT